MEWVGRCPISRSSEQLVVCDDTMFMFGGRETLEDGSKVPCNDLLVFVPNTMHKGALIILCTTSIPAGSLPKLTDHPYCQFLQGALYLVKYRAPWFWALLNTARRTGKVRPRT